MIKDYYHLTKPGIIRANVMTAAAGYLFAAGNAANWLEFTATLVGIAFIIAAACVHNNYLDREIDAKMERTKRRALVSGAIPIERALTFSGFMLVVGSLLLWTFVDTQVLVLGIAAYILYVYVYGYAKRVSSWGTLVGTVPGALSITAGYVAYEKQLDFSVAALFFIMVLWQMPHFYAIAIYRYKEYKAANVPVLSVVKGIPRAQKSVRAYMIAFTVVVLSLGFVHHMSWIYVAVISALSGWWMVAAFRSSSSEQYENWGKIVFGRSLVVLLGFSLLISLNSWLP